MANRGEQAARLVDRIRSSPALFASMLVLTGVVAVGFGLTVANVFGPGPNPTPSRADGVGDGDAAKDDPEGFAEWLFGGRDEQPAVDQYLQAERDLREQLALQAQLEQQGDDRARVLRGLGATAKPWTWLGPRNGGGRTRAFVVDPTNPDVMLAGGITGGVWRSEDGGKSWVPLTDTFSNIAINVLEIDPTNPKVMYAGTGEAYYKYWPRHRGNGIMKSTDGGLNWAFLEATATNEAFDWVGDIEVSHADSNRVYAATGTGVWLSTDGGKSWGSGPVLAATSEVGCLELAIRSDVTPDTVLASCGTDQSPEGVYRSADGGGKWEQVLPLQGEALGTASLAIAPSAQGTIYASVADTAGNAVGLYASTSAGAPGSWERRASPATGAPNWFAYCDRPKENGQGGYVTSLAVDPTDPNRLWIGGIDLYRSEDGGRTMHKASDWSRPLGSGGAAVHGDQHAIVFDPAYDGASNRTVYFANDGGLFRTSDDRAALQGTCLDVSGVEFQSLNNGYGISQFVGGSVSADGQVVIGGTQDNGTYRFDATGQGDWVPIWGADGGSTALASNGEWLIVSTYLGDFYRLQGPARTGASASCLRWHFDANCAAIGFLGDPDDPKDDLDAFLFYPPLERDSADALWTAGRKIWRSTDAGAHWSTVGSLDGEVASSIGVAPGADSVVYVGTYYGAVYRSADAAAASPTFQRVDGGFPATNVSAIAIDPNDPTTVFIGFKDFTGQQLWRSAHGGAFEAIDANLPETPVNAVAINPRNSNMVYVGTDVGIFESLDGGLTWRVANENLATTIVSRLEFRAGTSELFAFTFGRGAYRIDVGDASPPPNDLLAAATDVALAPEFRDVRDIRSASIAKDDPALSCGSAIAPAQTRSVWYRLTDAQGGRISVSTEGSNFDTVVAVHAADSAGGLTEVACGDDGAAGQDQAALAFDATAGTTYYIEVTRSASSPADTLANNLRLLISRG